MKSPIEFLREEADELEETVRSLTEMIDNARYPEAMSIHLRVAVKAAKLAREYRAAIDKLERD